MKKVLFFLIVFSFLFINLYPQSEIVIENFDNWIDNVHPEGFTMDRKEINYDAYPYLYGCILQAPGYRESGIKITDLFNDTINGGGTINKYIYKDGIVPDSIRIHFKQSIPYPMKQQIYVTFVLIQNGNFIGILGSIVESFFYPIDSTKWNVLTVPLDSDTPGEYINQIAIKFEMRCGPERNNEWRIYDDITLVYNNSMYVTRPKAEDKWMCGERDTIRWVALEDTTDLIKIEYSLDGGNSYQLIKDSVNVADKQYGWIVPEINPTSKARIKITNLNTLKNAESGHFAIKPYIITKKDNNGDLIVYDINKDRWGFSNEPDQMWPADWYNRFKYQTGKDPFTNNVYDQGAAGGVFAGAQSLERPDWVSFVNAFGRGVCYTEENNYRLPALAKWNSIKGPWHGSCFGIAVSNALAFENKYQFTSHFPFFPNFNNLVDVHSNNTDTSVIPVIMELFTHQYGNPHKFYRDQWAIHRTPTETINDIKDMLREDNVDIRTLSFNNNGPGGGGHAINVYKLEQDKDNPELYYVYVWDNCYPNVLDARILVDTSASGGKGAWDPEYGWDGWEGDKWFYIRDPANKYLNNATLPKGQAVQSSFLLDEDELEIYNKGNGFIAIKDNQGNQTGFDSSGVTADIPNSVPLMVEDGGLHPPYGYYLPKDNYSVELSNLTSDKVNTYFFNGNKSFEYERNGATQTQTDRMFFDGGVSVSNPDQQQKTIELKNIISDPYSVDDKLFSISSLELAENDSVKIINPDDNKLDLISYGTEKNYQIGLEYVTDVISSRFFHDNINLTENTTHKLVPNWGDFADLMLTIYVDEGNDGTIDDTLQLDNQLTGVNEEQGSLIPQEYRLEQNYPNPFNNTTVIRYSIPKEGLVTLKVYNAIGQEVATLVNETKQTGNYEVTFNSDNLTSGVYLYKLTSGGFTETKKMILLK